MILQQAKDAEKVIEYSGDANAKTHKVKDGRIVDKTPAEMASENPAPSAITPDKLPARITQGEWDELKQRIERLES